MATKEIEDGIRAYLKSLVAAGRPSIDKEAVKALKAQIKEAADPIEKLRLLAALEEEQNGRVQDNSGDKAVFVAEARAWAEAEGIPVTAFQTLRVPDEVLTEAGFTVPSPSPSAASSNNGGGARSPRIPLDDVRVATAKLGTSWKLSDLAELLERDAPTVRNYVNKLVEDGSVEIVGDDPNHDGRGRAAKIYSTV
jgi:hypothetical protein